MSQAPDPHFHLEDIDGVAVVRLVGPTLVADAGGPLHGLVDAGGHRKLLLDFAEIRFLSSGALGVLVLLQRKVDEAGGKLALCGLNVDLLDLLRITRLAEQFAIHEDEQEALAQF